VNKKEQKSLACLWGIEEYDHVLLTRYYGCKKQKKFVDSRRESNKVGSYFIAQVSQMPKR